MKKIIIAVLLLCMGLCLFACGENSGDESAASQENNSVNSVAESSEPAESEVESKEESKTIFEVKVVDGEGAPVANVMIQICKDSCIPAKTNESGVATFNLEITDGYKLSVLSCPEGYTYTGEAEIYLESGITEYTLEVTAGN